MENQLEGAAPKIIARGLQVMQANSIMPMLVNQDLTDIAQRPFSVINVNIIEDAVVTEVTPSVIAPVADVAKVRTVPLQLNERDGTSFTLTDTELTQIEHGIIPRIVDSRLEALASSVDKKIAIKAYKNCYNVVGAAGVTPYSADTSAMRAADRILNLALAPMNDRALVVNAYSKENLLGLQSFTDASASNDPNVITYGRLGHKLGFGIHMDQNIPHHTCGTADLTGGLSISGVQPLGETTLTIANISATTLVEGDIITIAGDTQTYVVRADVTWTAAGDKEVTIAPPLKITSVGGSAITLTDSHDMDLAFHKDSICFASSRVEDVIDKRLGNVIESRKDTGVSGIAICLEISRQHKQTNYQFDILYGVIVPRPEQIVRIIG